MDIVVSTQSVKKMTVLSESVTVKKGNRFRIYLVEKTNRT